jgi:hypothetical protein
MRRELMGCFGRRAIRRAESQMKRERISFVLRVTATLAVAGVLGCAAGLSAGIPREAAAQEPAYPSDESPMESAAPTPKELQQLVAPIALYPDELVAQILAAATYPEQIVEADRWMQRHGGLKGQQLAQEVDKEAWDPSVKALTAFPSVLANMDKNLSWTSSLGDAYVNHEPDVMTAIQDMRRRAQAAGNLKTTSQTKVTQDGQTVVIEPASPQVVYVPEYDPWVVYGAPVVAWPGWYWYPGLFVVGPDIAFGVGFDVGFFGGFGWGWHHWGCDWHRHTVVFNHNVFVSRGRTFVNRNAFNRGRLGFDRPGEFHGGEFHGGGSRGGGFHAGGLRGGSGFQSGVRGGTPAVHALPGRGFEAPRGQTGSRWGAFSGFDHGGVTRGDSLRGQSSFGSGVRGGGDFHGGVGDLHGGGGDFHAGGGGVHAGGFGGGFHGGGFHGGGGRR